MSKKKLVDGLLIVLVGIFLISTVMVGTYCYKGYAEKKAFIQLQKELKMEKESKTAIEKIKPKKTQEELDQEMIQGLGRIKEENGDLVGWLRISNTSIDYPVMHTPKNEQYYLRRGFDKKYALSGTPFAGGNSTFNPQSENVVIYGHNMKNGSMFADLLLYKSEAFFKENSKMEFYTLDEKQTYEIFAVLKTEVYSERGIDYYSFVNSKNEDDFNKYAQKLKKASMYDTGVNVVYGDHIIALSTCAYHTKNGRFVVIGKYSSPTENNDSEETSL